MQKEVKKTQKSSEKVLTFRRNDDNINKLAPGALLSAALILENDTDENNAKL